MLEMFKAAGHNARREKTLFLLDRLHAKLKVPPAEQALPGRPDAIPTSETHFVNGRPLKGPYPEHLKEIVLGMGCFWGVERLFWEMDGVWVTSVGYAAGHTPNPTYQEVCTGLTGHNEVVHVVYDPAITSLDMLLKAFFENHDPTQGMRQGNDVGTQYRSGIYPNSADDREIAERALATYRDALAEKGKGSVTTEIVMAPTYFYAEDYHQQYLAKNPGGYCNMKGTGVACPVPQDG